MAHPNATAAKWSGESLLALARGFQESRILLTAAELDLFTLLAAGPLDAEEIARRLGAKLRGLNILLDALAALGLLSKSDGRYACPAETARYLAANAPGSVLPMVLHSSGMWRRWSELSGIVRGDPDAIAKTQEPMDEAALAAFIGAMDVVSRPLAAEIAAVVKPGTACKLLDVGAGPGTYTIAFLAASPNLTATIFDRPAVVELARRFCAAAGVLDRVRFVAGDFYTDELPGGHDLALLSAIIHQNSPEENAALYRKVRRALLPRGRLVIRDHFVSPDRLLPRAAAIFAVNMLAGTPGGNVYTFEETRGALEAAGFERIGLLQPSDERMNGLVEAYVS